MRTDVIDHIDWVEHMRVAASGEPELFDGRLPEEWIVQKCRMAALICLTECPGVTVRLRRGRLSEADFAAVVCEMVLRVARWTGMRTESNGAYSYTRYDPQPNGPGLDPSPRLFLSKGERALLDGYGASHGMVGHVSLSLDPGYGW